MNRRLSYAEYGETVEALARGLVAAGLEPGEVLAILLSDCGVVGRPYDIAGEIPVALGVLRDGFASGSKLADELCAYVADRLTHCKQPREVHFVEWSAEDRFRKDPAPGI